MNRILWNRRPDGPRDPGEIDEIVAENCTVHIEQMGTRMWSVIITLPDGSMWFGNFHCDSRGRMGFSMQENDGVQWDRDDEHGEDHG